MSVIWTKGELLVPTEDARVSAMFPSSLWNLENLKNSQNQAKKQSVPELWVGLKNKQFFSFTDMLTCVPSQTHL